MADAPDGPGGPPRHEPPEAGEPAASPASPGTAPHGGAQAARADMVALCNTGDLQNSGDAVPFDVIYQGQTSCAFAIRYAGQAHAYLNRCAHVPMEMDFQPNRFFDTTGHWLICATHGATYHPATGACAAGPCRGGLVKIALSEVGSVVHWHTAHNLKPVEF